jgi:energy-coupling factor transporter ATP-binding protein EcfA2
VIHQLKVKAFKSLLDIEVDLGRVNVFIGANGSGKSNLLEALGVLSAATAGRVDDEALLRRGVRPGVPALYKSSFSGTRMRASIRLEASKGDACYSVELNNPLDDPEPAWTFKNELLKQGETRIVGRSPASSERLDPQRGLAALKAVELEPESLASRLIEQLAAFRIYSPDTNTLRGLRPDPQPGDPVGLAGGRLPEAIQGLLKARRSDPWLERVALEALGLIDWASSFGSRAASENIPRSPSVATSQRVLFFIDRFMAEKRNVLTGYDASEGALYVLFAAALATSKTAPTVLAIDNVDHGLNPRLARALMARLCDWVTQGPLDRQMLLTTHNPLVLDGLPLGRDDVRLFTVGRSRKGHTTVNRVQIDASDLQREGELWTVSRLWIMGHIGGVPDV